jgi:hypothetical protein
MAVRVDEGPLQSVESVEIVFGGDSEYHTFIQALEHAVAVLRAQQRQANAYASITVEIE